MRGLREFEEPEARHGGNAASAFRLTDCREFADSFSRLFVPFRGHLLILGSRLHLREGSPRRICDSLRQALRGNDGVQWGRSRFAGYPCDNEPRFLGSWDSPRNDRLADWVPDPRLREGRLSGMTD